MKARFYTLDTRMEVRVSNKSYNSIEGENKKVFLKRVAQLLEADFDEAIDIVEVPNSVIQSLNNDLLIEAYKVAKGLQEEIILAELTVREISVEKVEKVARKKVEKLDIEEVKKSEMYLNAKANIGKLVSFIPGKSDEVINGSVASISLNKTNTIIYYNIKVGTSLKCCTSKNETLTFYEF